MSFTDLVTRPSAVVRAYTGYVEEGEPVARVEPALPEPVLVIGLGPGIEVDGRPFRPGAERYGSHVGQGWCYVVVEDADAHHARAVEAGAEIVQGLELGTYRPELTPSRISASPDSN